MKICYVVGAGVLSELYINPENAFVAAADGGYRHLADACIVPDLIVGDYDSLGYKPKLPNVLAVPVEKDETDMALAIEKAEEKGCDTFILYGGTGGRPDHTFANLSLLTGLSKRGKRGYLIGNGFIMTAVTDSSVCFDAGESGTVSVFAAGDTAKGVTIEGLKYSLRGAELSFSVPLGVSNSFTGAESRISVEEGTLIIMWEEKNLSEFIDKLSNCYYNGCRRTEN